MSCQQLQADVRLPGQVDVKAAGKCMTDSAICQFSWSTIISVYVLCSLKSTRRKNVVDIGLQVTSTFYTMCNNVAG